MYPELSIPSRETDFQSCVRQSNEFLIPRPLALCFHYPEHPPADAYLADLARELDLKACLFDSDRKIHQLTWVSESDRADPDAIHQWILQLTRPRFQFIEHYSLSRIKGHEHISLAFDLVGLGLGAVSRIENNFFRNTVEPADYHAQLSRWRLPVARGRGLDTRLGVNPVS